MILNTLIILQTTNLIKKTIGFTEMFDDNNKLYDGLDDNFITTKISHLDIVFSKKWKRIGVNLSGGADSCLLVFLLGKIIQDNNLDCKIDIITFQRRWDTRPWQGWWSLQVFDNLKQIYPTIIDKRYTTFIPPALEHGEIGDIVNNRSGDQIIVGEFNKFASWEYNLDAVFNATSKNPDDSREDRMKDRDADASTANQSNLIWYSGEVKTHFCHPFKYVKKDWIVAQYHLYNMLDLYYTTRSCESDIERTELVSDVVPHFSRYSPGMDVPVCNECWWCSERNWADDRVPEIIREINELCDQQRGMKFEETFTEMRDIFK